MLVCLQDVLVANDHAIAARMYCHLCFGDIGTGASMVRTLLDKLINGTRVRVTPAVRAYFKVSAQACRAHWRPHTCVSHTCAQRYYGSGAGGST